MADPRSNPEQEEEQDGASPSELIIEACRRNNTDLLQEVITNCGSAEKAAVILNEAKTPMGNYAYHEAALRGNYEVIDMLLDQEGCECDPINRREGDTPLHSAVRWLNEQPENEETVEYGKALINMMIEAGSDPRIKNRALQTPLTLTNARNHSLRSILEEAILEIQQQAEAEAEAAQQARLEKQIQEEALAAGFVEDNDDVIVGKGNDRREEEEEDDYVGSASDSDFDIEEFRRKREGRRGRC